MPKQTKDQKRKAKLEKRRKAGERQLQQQTEMLIRMLTELCAPLLPEYTDDSKGPDLAGRAILYRLGQIAWDMEISQDLSFNDYAGKLGSLDDASREMIQKDVARLRERKRLLFPKTTLGIQNVSVVLRNGVPVLKLSPQVFAHVSMEPTPEICLADEFMAELEKSASQEEAEAMRKYHKADYRYLGVRVPVIAKAAKSLPRRIPRRISLPCVMVCGRCNAMRHTLLSGSCWNRKPSKIWMPSGNGWTVIRKTFRHGRWLTR